MKTRTTTLHLSGNRTVAITHETEAKSGKPCKTARDVAGSCALWSNLGDEELQAAIKRNSGVVGVVVSRY